MSDIKIYTDGSCLGNPGAGGWAAVVIDEENHRREEISGGAVYTTNNRMELSAAVAALKKISEGETAELFTDSGYLRNAFTKGWIEKWKGNGWKTATKTPVLNKDLWKELDTLISKRKIKFTWVKGHAGDFYNERCDTLARNEAKKNQALANKNARQNISKPVAENFQTPPPIFKPITKEEIQQEISPPVQINLFDL